jgi:choice-of-anchor B domain-containing protein
VTQTARRPLARSAASARLARPLDLASASALLAGAVGVQIATAHEDDPKARGLEPPIRAAAWRAADPGADGGVAGGFTSDGMSLGTWIPLNEFPGANSNGNDCWGYTSPSGREYAMIGIGNGTGFAEVTDPGNAQVIDFIGGPTSTWRDIKTYGEYAYAVTEGGGGIQIFDLSQIDAGVVTLVGTQAAGGTGNTHNVAIDTVSGFLYRCGGGSNGLRIYDLNADPTNPPYVGIWSDRYVHDAQIVTFESGPYAGRQIAFTFGGFNGGSTQTGVDILDVTDKSNILNLARLQYPAAAYCHQGWLSEDGTILYTLDEQDEINFGVTSTIHIVDVSDLENPVYVGSTSNGNPATTHNAYVVGDRLYSANYRSGVRIYDIGNLASPTEIAHFDTYPESDASGYNGCWSVYPYFASGTVIASDLQRGLFVLNVEPEIAQWSYPQGLPELIDPAGLDVEVEVVAGEGFELLPDTARLVLTRPDLGTSTIPMTPVGGDVYLASFPAMACGENVSYRFRIQSADGQVSISPAGVSVSALVAADSVSETDTLETDAGWIVGAAGDTATTGIWERVDPSGTSAQPEDDHTANGVRCFITGQHPVGSGAGTNDIDGGATTLTSPVLDASGLQEPYIRYWRWYSNNAGASPNEDSMSVDISGDDGATWVALETVVENAGAWVEKEFRIADFVEPSDSIRLRFVASDLGNGSLVEAGVDDVSIVGLDCGEVVPCPGDIDGNGIVNGADLGTLLEEWGTADVAADLNGDGIVNGSDLGVLLIGWGECS